MNSHHLLLYSDLSCINSFFYIGMYHVGLKICSIDKSYTKLLDKSSLHLCLQLLMSSRKGGGARVKKTDKVIGEF